MERRKPMTLVLEQNWRFDTRATVAEAQEQLRKTRKTTVRKNDRATHYKRAA